MKRLLGISLAVVLALLLPMAPVSAGDTEAKLIASDGAAFDYFGYSASISGGTVVVGAYYDDDDGTDSGSAYVYAEAQYTLAINIVGDGNVSLDPSEETYTQDTVVTLTAIPDDSGWAFDSWSGDLTGAANRDSMAPTSVLKRLYVNFPEVTCEYISCHRCSCLSNRSRSCSSSLRPVVASTGGGFLGVFGTVEAADGWS